MYNITWVSGMTLWLSIYILCNVVTQQGWSVIRQSYYGIIDPSPYATHSLLWCIYITTSIYFIKGYEITKQTKQNGNRLMDKNWWLPKRRRMGNGWKRCYSFQRVSRNYNPCIIVVFYAKLLSWVREPSSSKYSNFVSEKSSLWI